MRFFVAMRSRFAEDSARRAIEAGVRQILVLGAGLDTFAYRLEPCDGLRVFELDHPATQRDKRARLLQAGVAEPAHVAYVAHDFEHGDMTEALVRRRTPCRPADLRPVARRYALPDRRRGVRHTGGTRPLSRWGGGRVRLREPAAHDRRGEPARPPSQDGGAGGEERRALPLLFRGTPALHERARTLGFVEIEDFDRAALVARYLPHIPTKPRPVQGGHVVRMATR